MKYDMIQQEDEETNVKVVSVFEDGRWPAQVGISLTPDLSRDEAIRELRLAIAEGYRPTGDTTYELLRSTTS